MRGMNLALLGEENVRRFGEYVALHFEGREWTNVDGQRAANRLANALRRLGIGPGDRVVVMLPNCPEVLQAYAAILKLGAVIVPVIFLIAAYAWRRSATSWPTRARGSRSPRPSSWRSSRASRARPCWWAARRRARARTTS